MSSKSRNVSKNKKKENNTGLYIGFGIVVLVSILIIVLASISGSNTISETSNVSLKDNEVIEDDQNGEVESKIKSYELKDQFFATMLDDIFLNLDTYKGNRVTYEGYAYIEPDFNNEFFVTARTYFCCGTDSYVVGLECVYDDALKEKAFPANNAWIKVSGIITAQIDEYGVEYPQLVIDSIEELAERGKDVVEN